MKPGTSPCVCLVDAMSSGSLLAPALRDRGFRSIHVQTGKQMASSLKGSFVIADHAAQIVFDGDFERCLDEVAGHRPVCVIPGMEVGVLLADRLSERLGLPTNGSRLSAARRDKFEMQRRIGEAGLRCIPTHRATAWPSAEAWLTRLSRYPVVLKPPASAGTDHVHICRSAAEAKAAFERILGAITIFDASNDAVVIQPFIEGTEYIINSASCGGHHLVSDMWRMAKLAAEHPLYDYGELTPTTGEIADQLVGYAWRVLDALGIRFGAAHIELFWTDDGPVLIEVGARLDGQHIPMLCQEVLGHSQVTATLDAYLSPEQFFARPRPAPSRDVRRVELISPRSGVLKALPRLGELRALRSFHQVKLGVQPNQRIAKTIDFLTVPGFVDLVHPDPQAVQADHARIRAWEQQDFYRLEEDRSSR
jgi:biotin carboxylase